MEQRHKKQIAEMVGKKVKIYVSGKKVERVLYEKEDGNGWYIRYQNEKVPVKPDTTTYDILSFRALSPEDAAVIERQREKRQAAAATNENKPQEITTGDFKKLVRNKRLIEEGSKVINLHDVKIFKQLKAKQFIPPEHARSIPP